MSSSPEQSNSTTPQTTPHNISRGLSDVSMMSAASQGGSGGESPPRLNHPYHPGHHGSTLSPPQVLNVMGSPSSTPNSPHLGQRPSSGNLVKGMKRKFMRKTAHHPVVTHSSLPTPNLTTPPRDDSLDVATYHPNRALFARMLGQLQPKKMKHFRRTKRRPDKQYHSDDGYTSDPGILREEDDDETDNDPEENRRRIQELERKADKLRQSLEEDDMSLQENDEEVEPQPPPSHRFKLHRGSTSSSKNSDAIRAKLEKIDAQLKDLRGEGGTSRGSRLRGKMFMGIKGKLTPHGGWGKLRKKRVVVQDEEVLDDEEEEEDDGQVVEEDAIEEATPEALIAVLRVDLDTLRIACGESLEQSKKWRDDFMEQNERIEASLALLVEKFEQERERGERLEGQLNDITELHQNAVDDLRAQLTQIEHTTTNKCQDLEDAVESFQTKCDHLDARVHKLLDSNDVPKVNHLVRRPMASLLSFVLVLIAFFLKLVSIVRSRPVLKLFLVVAVLVLVYVCYTSHYSTTQT